MVDIKRDRQEILNRIKRTQTEYGYHLAVFEAAAAIEPVYMRWIELSLQVREVELAIRNMQRNRENVKDEIALERGIKDEKLMLRGARGAVEQAERDLDSVKSLWLPVVARKKRELELA